jgi:hypothetical protein
MSSYWINFATTGDPNGGSLPPWPRFDATAPAVMFLGEKIGAGALPNPERIELWDAYYARQPRSLSDYRNSSTPAPERGERAPAAALRQ